MSLRAERGEGFVRVEAKGRASMEARREAACELASALGGDVGSVSSVATHSTNETGLGVTKAFAPIPRAKTLGERLERPRLFGPMS